MTMKEIIVTFLLIIGHNMKMRVVADHFQHSIQTIVWHFKEVKQVLYQLSKILIHPSNMATYVVNIPKYFMLFKVRFYKFETHVH